MATYRFEGGALAQLHADFHSPHGRSRLEVHGTEGSLVGTDVLGKNPAHRGRVVRRTKSREEEVAVESDDSRYLRGIELFHAAVRGEGAPGLQWRRRHSLARHDPRRRAGRGERPHLSRQPRRARVPLKPHSGFFSQGGATRRRLPSVATATPGEPTPSRSHSSHVTSRWRWSSASQ